MSNKKSAELRQLDNQALAVRLKEAQDDVIGTRFNLATRQTENTAHLTQAKRQIARIKTILRERELEMEA